MPLKGGKSREAVSSNIRTEMHEYDRKGKIGTSHPESRKKAQKQAVAIALSKARKSGAKIPEKGHSKKASHYLAKIATMVGKEVKSIRKELKQHEKTDVVQEKKTNKYLKRLVEKKANKIIKDDAKATERKYNPNYKFFTLQKTRGC